MKLNFRREDTDQEASFEPLDANWLRAFPGCAHYSDRCADQVLTALTQLATLLLEVTGTAYVKEEKPSTTRKIPLLPTHQTKAA